MLGALLCRLPRFCFAIPPCSQSLFLLLTFIVLSLPAVGTVTVFVQPLYCTVTESPLCWVYTCNCDKRDCWNVIHVGFESFFGCTDKKIKSVYRLWGLWFTCGCMVYQWQEWDCFCAGRFTDLVTYIFLNQLSGYLLITSLVPGNTVGTDEKEGWALSALESVGCQHCGIEVVWPHSTCTCCCYIGNWRHELFLDGIFIIS